ncbi:MAG: VanZ family protein [Gemmatimonadota bacterium]
MVNQLRMWGPAAGWAAVLFLLSSWPNPTAPAWVAVNDKVVHLVLFGVLGCALAAGRSWGRSTVPHWVVIMVGVLYGAADEWYQSTVPNRTPSLADWYADVTGVLLGYLVITFLVKRAGSMSGAVQRTD